MYIIPIRREIKIIDTTKPKKQSKLRKLLVGGGALAVLLIMLATPGAAAINTTLIAQSMTDIGTILSSLDGIWNGLIDMVTGVMPVMIILAIIGFVIGLFTSILDKIKHGF